MKRRLLIAAWIIAATVPLLVATVFVVGCCVLPFHGVVHKLMPLCDMAANVMRGGGHDAEGASTPAPAREKQEPVKRIVTQVSNAFRVVPQNGAATATAPRATTAYRSFITLGAVRCDRDVGLHVLVETFLI